MPAYAKDGNVVCFFQSAHKFKARYATFGFSDKANLDEGTVAGRLCAEGVDRHRRGKDRRAREESGELRRSLHFQAQGSPPPNTLHQTAAMVKSAARPLVSCWSFNCPTKGKSRDENRRS